MHLILACMMLGTLLGAGLAVATDMTPATPPAKTPRYLARFDAQFKAADTDGDGALSRAELEAAHMNRVLENFDRLDVNKDGKITPEELRALLRSKLSS